MTTSKMKRNLFFHIGPPKTGSTSIQETFKLNYPKFNKFGIGGLCANGYGSHFELARRLSAPIISNKNNNDQIDAIFLTELEKNSGDFPAFDSFQSLFISSEDFLKISADGAIEVINFSEKNNAALQIVAVIRNPNEWIFSLWAQHTKSHWIDWHEFIESATSNKEGFLSTIFSPWLSQKVASIKISRFTRSNLIPSFIKMLGAPNMLLDELDLSMGSINNSMGICHSLYQAAISKFVLEEINTSIRLNFHRPSQGFIYRMLLDISDNSSPAWEIAAMYDVKTLEKMNILGSETYDLLDNFMASWIDDAFQFLNDAGQWLDQDSKNNILFIIESTQKALEDISRTSLPNKNFISRLPMNSQFIGLTRSIAASIVIADRNTKTTIA